MFHITIRVFKKNERKKEKKKKTLPQHIVSQCNNSCRVTDLQKAWIWKGPLDTTQSKPSAQTRVRKIRLYRALDISKDRGFTATPGNPLCLIIATLGKTTEETTWLEFSEFQFVSFIFSPVTGHCCEESHWAPLLHLHKLPLLSRACSHRWDFPQSFLFQADQFQLCWLLLLTCCLLWALLPPFAALTPVCPRASCWEAQTGHSISGVSL